MRPSELSLWRCFAPPAGTASVAILAFALGLGWHTTIRADDYERPPIDYANGPLADPVTKLVEQLEQGDARLEYDDRHGWLPSLLEALDIPRSSQMLVFSKTSLQRHRITPRHPRALYFNDDVYVGWCDQGDVLEISSVDPRQGAVFFSVDQNERERPVLMRQMDRCTLCHSSSQTLGVPGHVVRSVFPDRAGEPVYASGTFRIDHTSPFEKRWGGWYVTGTHGEQRHMGNALVARGSDTDSLDREAGANLTDIADKFAAGKYLTPHSDIVALMVFEHQTMMHNLITKASYQTRIALHQEAELRELLELKEGERSESTQARIRGAGETLLRYLLFCEEAPLTDAVRGTSGFAEEFARRGPRDSRGRSLREFDLEKRLFRYPCSYLIHSQAFAALPPEMKDYLHRRLWDVLTGRDDDPRFAHLAPEDRTAILEILRDTLDDPPEQWRTESP
ncbi:MAG: hypothetical protein WD066_12740 [Planctomycetaceae bacterium]